MRSNKDVTTLPSSRDEIASFIDRVKAMSVRQSMPCQGRLIFALDATASRQSMWDQACHLQSTMFQATQVLGKLDIQLVFYRGFHECKTSRWLSNTHDLQRKMTAVTCLGGLTQIGRVLRHAINETQKTKVDALVFIGDCMEEDCDVLCDHAGSLGLLKVPVFVFQEGNNVTAYKVFKQIARLSGGAHCTFDINSAEYLKNLLSAVAVYASGGYTALQTYSQDKPIVRQITDQLIATRYRSSHS